ncbi:hypothetical protein HPB50_011678 [Hyalomma asiaticum]|uniref:Uncharacterized protein n=1 Tax=Hyalomma asiaticum TaxID=266040 RepID=A0ACB7T180_HYAAI|nr:hypothetical protein HPB50_011678 [Hyalomma asiaticum]
MLDTILWHTFDQAYLSQHLPDLQSHLQKVKAVVTFMKQSGLASRLLHGICQEASTQWSSKVAMLKSVYTEFKEIKNIIEEMGSSLMDNLSEVFIKDNIDLLEPFKEATEKLEKDKQPTLHLVLSYNVKLQKHLPGAQTGSPTVDALKRRATAHLKSHGVETRRWGHPILQWKETEKHFNEQSAKFLQLQEALKLITCDLTLSQLCSPTFLRSQLKKALPLL